MNDNDNELGRIVAGGQRKLPPVPEFRGWFSKLPSWSGYLTPEKPPISANEMEIGTVYESSEGFLWHVTTTSIEGSLRRRWTPAISVTPAQLATGKRIQWIVGGSGTLIVGGLLATAWQVTSDVPYLLRLGNQTLWWLVGYAVVVGLITSIFWGLVTRNLWYAAPLADVGQNRVIHFQRRTAARRMDSPVETILSTRPGISTEALLASLPGVDKLEILSAICRDSRRMGFGADDDGRWWLAEHSAFVASHLANDRTTPYCQGAVRLIQAVSGSGANDDHR